MAAGSVDVAACLSDTAENMRVPIAEWTSASLPPATQFVRDFVGRSAPVVLRRAAAHWKVCSWSRSHLISVLGGPDASVPVAITPDGWADAVHPRSSAFLEPLETRVNVASFFSLLDSFDTVRLDGEGAHQPLSAASTLEGRDARRPVVAYSQSQNGCLDRDPTWSRLLPHVPEEIERFGVEVFGCPCDARNVWLGGEESVTSLHQDWYENLYVVTHGVKHFRLLPPWCAQLVPKVRSPRSVWGWRTGAAVGEGSDATAWAADDLEERPLFVVDEATGRPIRDEVPWVPHPLAAPAAAAVVSVDVRAGDVLYLPAMWFHEVSQSAATTGGGENAGFNAVLAFNYWFDMSFDSPAYHLQALIKRLSGESA